MKNILKMNKEEILEMISQLSQQTQSGNTQITPFEFNEIVIASLKKMFFTKGVWSMDSSNEKISEAEKLLREAI